MFSPADHTTGFCGANIERGAGGGGGGSGPFKLWHVTVYVSQVLAKIVAYFDFARNSGNLLAMTIATPVTLE